jgi:Na+-driven multidrug efflux pump
MAASALGLKIIFARHWGVSGVPWALVISYVLCVAIPMAVYIPMLLRRLDAAPRRQT